MGASTGKPRLPARTMRHQSPPPATSLKLPRILVVGDIHHEWERAEALLQNLRSRYDQAVLLGDYFDDEGDSAAMAAATARWLARSLARPERIHLLGNHDLSYIFPTNAHLWTPDFSGEKCLAIEEELKAAPIKQLRLAWAAGGWLFSHAGFNGRIAAGATAAALARRANALLPKLAEDRYEPWVAPGRARGGLEKIGGITWLDWEREFAPIAGLNQVVGHTPTPAAILGRHLRADGKDVTVIVPAKGRQTRLGLDPAEGWSSVNWCLDTGLDLVAILHDQKLTAVRIGTSGAVLDRGR